MELDPTGMTGQDIEKSQKHKDFEYQGRNPLVKKLLNLAYKDFPAAKNDLEAVFASVMKQRDVTRKQVTDFERTIQRQQKLLKGVEAELDRTEAELDQTENTNVRQEKEIINAECKIPNIAIEDYNAAVKGGSNE